MKQQVEYRKVKMSKSEMDFASRVQNSVSRSLKQELYHENVYGKHNLYETGDYSKSFLLGKDLKAVRIEYENLKKSSLRFNLITTVIEFALVFSMLLLIAGTYHQPASAPKMTMAKQETKAPEMLSAYMEQEAIDMAMITPAPAKTSALKEVKASPRRISMEPAIPAPSLAVRFESFRVKLVNNQADIKWIDSEQQAVSYMIEKSDDGVNFEIFQVVDSKPMSDAITYLTRDINPAAFYRLVKVVHNGGVAQSKVFDVFGRDNFQAEKSVIPSSDDIASEGTPS